MRARSEPDGWAIIINRAKNGDRAAFDQLASCYRDRLRRFISRKVSDDEDSADLCQEVLFRAYSKLGTFRGDSDLDTWLISIAKRAIAEYYRSGLGPANLSRHRIDTASESRTKTFQSYDHCFEQICDIRDQIRNCLICIMKNLTHEQQVALLLSDIYGFSDKVSCRVIGKKLGLFKHLLHKSRQIMNRISDQSCAVVQKNGDFSQCLSRNSLNRQLVPTLPFGMNLKNAPLPVPSELLSEINSLINSQGQLS